MARLRVRIKARRATLKGDLVFATVMQALAETGKLFDSGSSWQIDLAGVRAADSAALALMLEWAARARARQGYLRFEHPPEAILDLARVSHIDGLLGLTQAAA